MYYLILGIFLSPLFYYFFVFPSFFSLCPVTGITLSAIGIKVIAVAFMGIVDYSLLKKYSTAWVNSSPINYLISLKKMAEYQSWPSALSDLREKRVFLISSLVTRQTREAFCDFESLFPPPPTVVVGYFEGWDQ